MKLSSIKPVPVAARAAMTAVLALGLVACEQKPPPRPVVQPVQPAAPAAPAVPAAPVPEVQAAPKKPAEPSRFAEDRALAAKVKEALLAEPVLKAHGIDVVAKDGVVTLYGTADTRMRREMATKVAARVEGVKSVENKLAVVAGS